MFTSEHKPEKNDRLDWWLNGTFFWNTVFKYFKYFKYFLADSGKKKPAFLEFATLLKDDQVFSIQFECLQQRLLRSFVKLWEN